MTILKNPKYQFAFFISILLILNLLQSIYTPLLGDEAYYWVWSKDLAFGYFDHPPLVALWIKISGLFFNGELGVRFLSSISFSLMLVLIWKTIDYENKKDFVWLFFLLVNAMALLNIYGFITTPDTPLLLFVALFLFAYHKFLQKENNFNTLFLGFTMAAMLYSKYHGILVIFFVVLSNLSLLKNKKFWFSSLFGLVLFIPHLYWQYANGFPSFVYHLKERGKKLYRIDNTILYFENLIAIVGITFPVVYIAFFKTKAKNVFEKSLKFIVYGFIIFFFFTTFTSRPQAQWENIILIPIILLTFSYFVQFPKARKWLIILSSIQFVIIIMARVFLVDKNISPIKLEFHAAQNWVPKLKSKTDGEPIVFMNSYKRASLYNFYTGVKTHSYSSLQGRQSQYDLLEFENKMQNKNIIAVGKKLNGQALYTFDKSIFYGINIPNYHTFQKVKCIIPIKELNLKSGIKQKISFDFINTYDKTITFEKAHFKGVFQGKKNKILKIIPLSIKGLRPLNGKEKIELEAEFITPDIAFDKNTTFRIAIQFYDLFEGFQGNRVKVKK